MKFLNSIKCFALLACMTCFAAPASAQLSQAISYQGFLEDGGSPANGSYDFRFIRQLLGGGSPSVPIELDNVPVVNGVFTVQLGFTAPFNLVNYELVIGVRSGASIGAYTDLFPNTPLTPAPQALTAEVAGLAMAVSANSITNAAMADNSIGAAEIIDGSIGSAEVAADSLTAADISESGLAIAGDVTGTLGSSLLAANSVASPEVANNSLRLVDLAFGVRSGGTIDLFSTNVAAGDCSVSFNDPIAAGAAPAGSFTFVTEARLANGGVNPGWTVEGRQTTTAGSARLAVCNYTGALAEAPNLYFSYITISP